MAETGLDFSPRADLNPPKDNLTDPKKRGKVKLLDTLRSLLGKKRQKEITIENSQEGYEFFTVPEARKELVEIGQKIAEYLHTNNIKKIVFVDRAARPGYIVLKECWKKMYPNSPQPEIFFINPDGFEEKSFLVLEGFPKLSVGYHILKEAQEKGEIVSNKIIKEEFKAPKTQEEIDSEFKETYSRLLQDKENPILLFDICIHTGNSIRSILIDLARVGFSYQNIKVGLVHNTTNATEIKPELVILDEMPTFKCHPFDEDRMIRMTFGRTSSKPNEDIPSRERSVRLRKEIKRIVNENFPVPIPQEKPI